MITGIAGALWRSVIYWSGGDDRSARKQNWILQQTAIDHRTQFRHELVAHVHNAVKVTRAWSIPFCPRKFNPMTTENACGTHETSGRIQVTACRTMPMFESFTLNHAIFRLVGRDFAEYLMQNRMERGFSYIAAAGREIVLGVIENFVSYWTVSLVRRTLLPRRKDLYANAVSSGGTATFEEFAWRRNRRRWFFSRWRARWLKHQSGCGRYGLEVPPCFLAALPMKLYSCFHSEVSLAKLFNIVSRHRVIRTSWMTITRATKRLRSCTKTRQHGLRGVMPWELSRDSSFGCTRLNFERSDTTRSCRSNWTKHDDGTTVSRQDGRRFEEWTTGQTANPQWEGEGIQE